MPKSKSSTRERIYAVARGDVYRQVGQSHYFLCVAPEDAAAGIAEVLDESIEHPWVDDGPTVEEAGGESILARIGEDLVRGYRISGKWYHSRADKAPILLSEAGATGWRRMPKAPKGENQDG